MAPRSRSRSNRRLHVESLESRRMFVVEVIVPPTVVSTFDAPAQVTGLQLELSTQASEVRTIDTTGIRQVIREIDGVLYSVKDNLVFETSTATGATQTRTLTPLAGSTKVEILDVAQLNGIVTFVGASLSDKGPADGSPSPTKWEEDGVPIAIGPTGVTGKATFANSSGIIGGYYKKASGEYVPWVHSGFGDFDLPGSANPLAEQMITSSADSGYFLAGYETDKPMFWSSSADPTAGAFDLFVSPEAPLLYPDGAVLGNAGKKFQIVEHPGAQIYMLGQFDLPVISQGQITGYQTHTGIWNIAGNLEYDLGANTEMLGVVNFGSRLVVAHRNSVSLIESNGTFAVTTIPLNNLLPELPPAGTTTRILEDGLVIIGDAGQTTLGINYAESSGGTTQNKLLIQRLRIPDQVQIDGEDDGTFEVSAFGDDMFQPIFKPLGYGTRTLRARVTYSDGTTADAVTTYESLRYDATVLDGQNVLMMGGTAGGDTATVTQLGPGSYRASIAGQTRDFDNIDSLLVDLSENDDTLILAGEIAIDLATLSGVENLNLTDAAIQTINSVDSTAIQLQVDTDGAVLIKANPDDLIDLIGDWQLQAPKLINNLPTAHLTQDGYTLYLQTGLYTNPIDNLDVTFDGFITALDALIVINHINQSGAGQTPAIEGYVDVNGNGSVTALDVLLVINFINTSGAGEGESPADATFIAEHSGITSFDPVTDLETVGQIRKRR